MNGENASRSSCGWNYLFVWPMLQSGSIWETCLKTAIIVAITFGALPRNVIEISVTAAIKCLGLPTVFLFRKLASVNQVRSGGLTRAVWHAASFQPHSRDMCV